MLPTYFLLGHINTQIKFTALSTGRYPKHASMKGHIFCHKGLIAVVEILVAFTQGDEVDHNYSRLLVHKCSA